MIGKPLAAIVSAGLSKFGRREGLYGRDLFAEAVKETYDRCPNLDPRRDIKALFIGQAIPESLEHQSHIGPLASNAAGLIPAPAVRIENACASAGFALRCGVLAVASGLADVALVGGVEKMTHRATPDVTEGLGTALDNWISQWGGLTFPGVFALMATAHMDRYGTREEHLAMIAVKNHYNGSLNPKAHMQRVITLEEAMESRVIAWPLRLYDCSLITDGASCAVLTRPELAKRFSDTPVYITGSGAACDTLETHEREDFTTSLATKTASQEAYRMAGVEPKDVDLAEVHDCFTIAELVTYEDLGFCGPGEGGRLIEEGQTKIDGAIPVNTSGGLKAKGHPVGATGVAQAYEIYLQLLGEAGRRQVSGAEIGLSHNFGGFAASCAVHVYERGG
ncbi:MAG: thiolase domain-containing protein [Candidatus Geothermarchaeales archaeon]